MNKFILLIFFPLVIFAQNSEEYNVYNNFILNKFSESKKIVILIKETNVLSEEKLQELKYESLTKFFLKSLAKETFNDFLEKNKSNSNLYSFFRGNREIKTVDEREIHEIFKNINTGWNDFYKKYPNASGILRLSRIGFNKAKTQAFFYFEKTSGMLNGSGNYILFEKMEDKWILKGSFMSWIS